MTKQLLLAIALLIATGLSAAAQPSQRPIGYVGCSNTEAAVAAYNNLHAFPLTAKLIWPYDPGVYELAGDYIAKWSSANAPQWSGFDRMAAIFGTPKAVWIQLCEQDLVHPDSYENVRALFAHLREHAPGAGYYVSAINLYRPATLCPFMGPQAQGESDTTAWRDRAVAEGLAQPGPELGPLTPQLVQTDGCHPDIPGMQLLGSQLHAFFDGIFSGAPGAGNTALATVPAAR